MPPFVPGLPQVKLMKAPIGECWALNPMGQDKRLDIVPSVGLLLRERLPRRSVSSSAIDRVFSDDSGYRNRNAAAARNARPAYRLPVSTMPDCAVAVCVAASDTTP